MVTNSPDQRPYLPYPALTRTPFSIPPISLQNQLAVYTGLYGGALLTLIGSGYDQPLLTVAGAGLMAAGLELIRETVNARLEMRSRMTDGNLTGLDAVLAKKLF